MKVKAPVRQLIEAQESMLLTARKNRLIAYHVACNMPVIDVFLPGNPRNPTVKWLGQMLTSEEQTSLGVALAFAEHQVSRITMMERHDIHASQQLLSRRYGFSRPESMTDLLALRLRGLCVAVAAGATSAQAPSAARLVINFAYRYARVAYLAHFDRHPIDVMFSSLRIDEAKQRAIDCVDRIISDIAMPSVDYWDNRIWPADLRASAEGTAAHGHRTDDMLILADAIADLAGGNPLAELAEQHCRSGCQHFAGCWVTDLIRGLR